MTNSVAGAALNDAASCLAEPPSRPAARRLRLVTGLALRLSLGVIFVTSSLPKISQPHQLLGDVYGYRLVSPDLGVAIAAVLPYLELAVGLCLLTGLFVSGAVLAASLMGAAFVVVQSSALHRGLFIACGCSGRREIVSSSTLAWSGLVLLMALTALCLQLFWREPVELASLDPGEKP